MFIRYPSLRKIVTIQQSWLLCAFIILCYVHLLFTLTINSFPEASLCSLNNQFQQSEQACLAKQQMLMLLLYLFIYKTVSNHYSLLRPSNFCPL